MAKDTIRHALRSADGRFAPRVAPIKSAKPDGRPVAGNTVFRVGGGDR
jgi:hypothetical protein